MQQINVDKNKLKKTFGLFAHTPSDFNATADNKPDGVRPYKMNL